MPWQAISADENMPQINIGDVFTKDDVRYLLFSIILCSLSSSKIKSSSVEHNYKVGRICHTPGVVPRLLCVVCVHYN